MRVADAVSCARCPYCRSTSIYATRCRKCTRNFSEPFMGTKYEKVQTKDAAPSMTIGRGVSKW